MVRIAHIDHIDDAGERNLRELVDDAARLHLESFAKISLNRVDLSLDVGLCPQVGSLASGGGIKTLLAVVKLRIALEIGLGGVVRRNEFVDECYLEWSEIIVGRHGSDRLWLSVGELAFEFVFLRLLAVGSSAFAILGAGPELDGEGWRELVTALLAKVLLVGVGGDLGTDGLKKSLTRALGLEHTEESALGNPGHSSHEPLLGPHLAIRELAAHHAVNVLGPIDNVHEPRHFIPVPLGLAGLLRRRLIALLRHR